MGNVFDILKERGFIAQSSNEEEVRRQFGEEKVTFYCGYDPTADSLHVGHFLTLMAAAHIQRAGHRFIALVGGGTASIGDPSGKNDMRKMLTNEELQYNANCLKNQISRFVDFNEDKAIMANNADWLFGIEYIPFLRDIAVHFSVNRMLTAECYKSRMEKGLTLLEFNYMVMQSYDFLQLNKKYGCSLQVGGDDQWSNMLGGIDLIRKKEKKTANVLTFTLLTTSEGKKMGKTEKGALWLDSNKTTPYEFYQYWRNTGDGDVEKCLALLTFLPMEEVRILGALKDSEINKAKEVLAFEVTKIVHGEEEAIKAQNAAKSLFGERNNEGSIPTTVITNEEINKGIDIITLLQTCALIPSRSEGRRLVQQGGVKINDEKIEKLDITINTNHVKDGYIVIQKGRKTFHRIEIK